MAVLQPLLLQLVLGLQHLRLGFLQSIIKTAQDRKGQDDLLELAFLESAVEQIGNRPEEADDGVEFGGFVHGVRQYSKSRLALEKDLRGRDETCPRARVRNRP